MTTITEAFDLPRPEDIRAMGFVIRLKDASPEELQKLVDDYVVTPAVERELPVILRDMKQVFDRGDEYGRFIHGSFGSGKSHFMTILGMLLESTPAAWKKLRPMAQPANEAWIRDANLLVVRIHMLSIKGKSTGLDRAVYEAFNVALAKRGKKPFEFLHVDAIFEEVRREARDYGDVVWKHLEAAGIVGGQGEFEALASGSAQARERFARAWLAHKGRDPADAGIDPRWSEGLHRLTAHAKDQGFGGVVLLVDEYILWLGEKAVHEFIQEINNLDAIVDHATGQRAAPLFVFVARQRDIRDFYPDLASESRIHEYLDHHAQRFETTKLQDVELRHIVKGRVLRPKQPEAIRKVVGALREKHEKVLPGLLAGADLAYLEDVYPFHPALIEMLVDVTSLMQRERSALRLLYELLVIEYPSLPLGEFLPVGSAFAAIFPRAGVEASQKVELMQDIHHQYYARLAPAIELLVKEVPDMSKERRDALDQLVKTVLLGEVSPRLKGQGLTIERLVQLNQADVEGETFRGQVGIAQTDLLALSQKVPDLQIAGTGKTAVVVYVLGRVSLGDMLARARSKADSAPLRFGVFWAALKEALELSDDKGFREGEQNEGEWELTWRKTKRKGTLKLGNVRDLALEQFVEPEGTFRVIIDYPWDEPGHTVDEDRHKAAAAKKAKGARHTACWLPRHMTPGELGVLTEICAVRYLLSPGGQAELLSTLAQQDRNKLLELAGIREKNLEGQLRDLLREVYIQHGEFYCLIPDIDPARPHPELLANLQHIATVLMDRRYKEHPQFQVVPQKADLELLLNWMVQAAETNVSVAYDEATGKVLRSLGQPLELVNLGQTKASLRLDSRYIKDVLQRADKDSVSWSPIAEHLRDTYGFQQPIIDLFLCFLCQRDHRALRQPSGEAVDVKIGMPVGTNILLQRGGLIAAADWHRLRDLGSQLFGLERPPTHRSLQIQDRFADRMKAGGRERGDVLTGIYSRLGALGAGGGDRAKEVAEANDRLKALHSASSDSHAVLTELLKVWPDAGSDPLRALVHQATNVRDALADVRDATRNQLREGTNHTQVGLEVAAHLAKLDDQLKARESEKPLTRDWVKAWNEEGERLVHALIRRDVAVVPEPLPPVRATPPVAVVTTNVVAQGRVDPANAASIDDFVAKVRAALGKETRPIRVKLVREDGE